MSSRTVNQWRTKADILNDLAEVTGRFADVDEEFIVVGEEPPPIRRCDGDDEEYNLRFSGVNGAYEMQFETMKPDLRGITKMLRMVEEQQETPENGVTCSPKNKKDGVITISKLNPNVPEFVPKGAIESSPRIKKSFNGDNRVNDDENSNKEKLEKDCNNDKIIRIDKKFDISKLNAEEIKDITLKLKNKISDVSKKDDLHTKKEKNVAIAALLKLYTAPPRTDPEEKEEPIKLITPDYFATCPPSEKEVRCEVHNVVINVNPESCNNAFTNKISEVSDTSARNSQTLSSVEDDTSTQSGKTSPKSYRESPSEINHFPHDPNVQKSIKKVTSWLSKPESPKPKGPVVCLGPISFKKKGVKTSVSDESSIKSNSSLNVSHQIGNFVPSKRAEDLSKKYSERGREIESRSEDIWTKAIKQMKAIETKKKLEQSTSQSDSRDDEGSSGSTS